MVAIDLGVLFDVISSGGGIGGLTFAVAIARYSDVEVEVYEATNEFSPIGAGIGIWPRLWKILSSIGLDSLAMKASCQPSDDPGRIFSPVCE